ncbi:MAG: hypothetical protein ACOC44_11985 [Promethearchaeia archaeon]
MTDPKSVVKKALYLFGVMLFLTFFTEKGVQILFMINITLYITLHQIFLVNLSRFDIFDYLLINITGNHAILLANLFCFTFIAVLFLISGIYISAAYLNPDESTDEETRDLMNHNANYCMALSNIFFIFYALILASIFAHELVGPEVDTRAYEYAIRSIIEMC